MAIKALIFDNFGVLMSPVYGSLAGLLPEVAQPQLQKIFDEADSGQIAATAQRHRLTQLLDSYGRGGQDEIEAAIQRSTRNQSLFDFILVNRPKYKTAILSNCSAVFWNYYQADELSNYFDQLILSYREKLAKPDPAIYQLACQRLGVEPAECVFTDDNVVNITAAQAIGMQAIVFTGTDDYQVKLADKVKNA